MNPMILVHTYIHMLWHTYSRIILYTGQCGCVYESVHKSLWVWGIEPETSGVKVTKRYLLNHEADIYIR